MANIYIELNQDFYVIQYLRYQYEIYPQLLYTAVDFFFHFFPFSVLSFILQYSWFDPNYNFAMKQRQSRSLRIMNSNWQRQLILQPPSFIFWITVSIRNLKKIVYFHFQHFIGKSYAVVLPPSELRSERSSDPRQLSAIFKCPK